MPKQITSSKVHPGTQMKDGEWRFSSKFRKLFHKYGGILHEWTADSGKSEYRSLTAEIEDISTAGQIYVVSPYKGKVVKVYSVINGAIANVDAILTVKDKGGNSMGTITVAYSGSAAGDVDSLTPTANNALCAGDTVEIETNGGSTNAVKCVITVRIKLYG